MSISVVCILLSGGKFCGKQVSIEMSGTYDIMSYDLYVATVVLVLVVVVVVVVVEVVVVIIVVVISTCSGR